KEHSQGLIGSEFLGLKVRPGKTNIRGIRNENLTDLSFEPNTIDKILSFDCFEHIADYKTALLECNRVLRTGGSMLCSVPFHRGSAHNIVRATVLDNGEIQHHTEPEYHGDPLSSQGCLSYYTFGWEFLDDLREAGFSTVYAALIWSDIFGYLGNEQIAFVATK
ncbi:MAG: methyltransferase domain-containing protein, partial [Pseudomonadota bacterium]